MLHSLLQSADTDGSLEKAGGHFQKSSNIYAIKTSKIKVNPDC